jgi:hypothetical protein
MIVLLILGENIRLTPKDQDYDHEQEQDGSPWANLWNA